MGLIGAVCTAAYMTRAIWYCFYGERRGASATHDMHENGPRITVPLIVLAIGAIFAGFTNLPDTGVFSFVPGRRRCVRRRHCRRHGCGRETGRSRSQRSRRRGGVGA